MRFISITLIMCLAAAGLQGQTKPEKTIADLKEAYNGESNASAKYAKYAEIAHNEGYMNIAILFKATSKAESVHAANHLAVLNKLGVKLSGPDLKPFTPGTTAENLADGIKGETWEYESMYPPMIKHSEDEGAFEATVSLRYAKDTEKRHRVIYEKALASLKAKQEASVSNTWYVCPTCGNTYSTADLAVSCEFCGTLRPRFLSFK